MRLLVLAALLFSCFVSAISEPLARVVPVGDSSKKPTGISLVAASDEIITAPASTMKAKPVAAAPVHSAAAPVASNVAARSAPSSASAQVAVAVESKVSSKASSMAENRASTANMMKEEVAHANNVGWVFDKEGTEADDESDRGERSLAMASRRARRRAWIRLRFSTSCPKGDAGRECREVRNARYEVYRRARKAYLKRHWNRYSNVVKRRCRGPWTTRCPEGPDMEICRTQRRRWRRKCKAAAFRRRRRSCRGPWTTRCPSDKTENARACRRTRRSYRRRCRERRLLQKKRGNLSGTVDRIARFQARLLASRSSYLIKSKRVKLVYIGRNRVLEWRPRTGYFQIFRVRRKSLDRISSRPVWRKRERVAWGRWAKLIKPYRLVYIGRKRLLAHNKRNGKYRLFKISDGVTGNANPLTLQAKGRWRRAKGRSLIYLGGRRLATFRRKTGRYAVWKVNTRKVGTNKRVFKLRTKASSWIFARRRAKYLYVGKGTVLQWHKNKYRLINFNRRAKGVRPAFRYIKGGAMDEAMKRQWPYRAGQPGVRVVYLGGKLLVFYRTKAAGQAAADGTALNRLQLYPFKITVLNNPKFSPVGAARPYLISKPWLQGSAWQTSTAYKPWLTDPRYCLDYKTWTPAGRAVFTTRNKIARLSNAAGSSDNRMVRIGRVLLDWSPSTGSYRMLKYSKDAKMYTQVSFGVFPGFKANWQLIALGKRRILNFNPATRRFVLYPVDGYDIRRPISSGTLPVPRGFKLIPMGAKQILAWNPTNGQWRVYRVNADVTGVKTSPLRRMIAGGQWCDIKAGTTVLALGRRNILAIDKRSGEYSLFRFNKWAKGRRGNVFKSVLARGTWADPFLNSRTRLIALRGGRILGWLPSRKNRGALYTTWIMGYIAGETNELGTVTDEASKLLATLKSVRRSLKLRGRNIDPEMALLQKPNFGGLSFRSLKRMIGAHLQDIDVKFPWKSTLNSFRDMQKQRARGMAVEGPERSNGARRTPNAGIYGLGAANDAQLGSETPPDVASLSTSTNANLNDIPLVNAPAKTTSSAAPGVESGPGGLLKKPLSLEEMGGNDVWPDGSKVEEDMFDDGTGPVKGSIKPQDINPLTRSDNLVQFNWENFPQEDVQGTLPIPTEIPGTISGPPGSDFHDAGVDDSMAVGDQQSPGITSFEEKMDSSSSAGLVSAKALAEMDGQKFFQDTVGDEPNNYVYPKRLRDYVGRRDNLKDPLVPGDGEPPLDLIH